MLKSAVIVSLSVLFFVGCAKPTGSASSRTESAVLALSAFYPGEQAPASDPNLRGVISTSATDGGFIAPPPGSGAGADQGSIPAPGNPAPVIPAPADPTPGGPIASNPTVPPAPAPGDAPSSVPPAPVVPPAPGTPSDPNVAGGTPAPGTNPTPGGTDGGNIAPPANPGGQSDSGNVAQNPPPSSPTQPPSGPSTPPPSGPIAGGTTPPPSGPIAQNPPGTTPPGSGNVPGPTTPPGSDGGNVPGPTTPPGSDGGSIGQNPPQTPPQDGGSVCVNGKDCLSIEVELSRVCSARRSLIPFPEFVFFEEARRPLLTFESDISACVRAPNSRSLASMSGNLPHPVESQLVRMLLGSASSNPRNYAFGSESLARVDLLKGKYRTRLALKLNQIRTWFPQSWSNLYVNARVCDDTNQDGLCEGEKASNQLLAQTSGFRLSRVPSKINLLVWNGRSRTLREDPRLCEMQISPLVLDLNGDGLKFSAAEEGVVFDLDGNGEPVLSAWATTQDDALLVRDLDKNGLIESGRELFGSATFLKNGLKARNGFLALADLDSNANGLFDRGDREWNDVELWIDRNRDGISDPGELMGLSRVRLESIDLGYVDSAEIDPYGNETRQRSTYRLTSPAGKAFVRQVIDIWFSTLKLQ